jgi:hypothetical protein
MLDHPSRLFLGSPDIEAHVPSRSEWQELCDKLCPRGMTLIAFSTTLDSQVLIGTRCGTFACPCCGPRKQAKMAILTELACPNRLITLTIRPSCYKDPRDAYDQTRRQLSQLSKGLRLVLKEFEYLRVLEATKAGWPHYHLVARCPFIKQTVLSKMWQKLTNAPIVDVRRIDQAQGVFNYVMKYLAKQVEVPWTKRRISWTRNFFQKTERDDRPGLELVRIKRDRDHVTEVMDRLPPGQDVIQLGDNLFRIKVVGPPGTHGGPST